MTAPDDTGRDSGAGATATTASNSGVVHSALADSALADSQLADSQEAASDPVTEPPRGGVVDWVLVVLITVLAAWTALLALAFLPLHIGWLPFPISALLGVVAMIAAPRACYALTRSMIAAVLPVAAWFAVSVWLVLTRNPIMPGVPLTVVEGQWRVMVLLGLGSLAAAATIGLLWGDRLRDRLAAERAAAQARDLDPEPVPETR